METDLYGPTTLMTTTGVNKTVNLGGCKVKITRQHGMVLGLVLVLIAIVSLMISWSGNDGDIARELEEEPEISVFFHETGEARTMMLEEYLQGVVAGEMFPDWPIEAYAAQAIFARSFTMGFIADGGLQDKYGTDISTDIREAQAYNADGITPEITQAVEMTRGEVMTFDNRFAKAWFHAYSGGITATAVEGLGFTGDEPPYITSITLPENEYAPDDVVSWTAEYPADELQTLLSKAGFDVGEIQDVRIVERGETERITIIEVEGSNRTESMHGQEFRVAIDSTRMRSTLVNEFEFADGVMQMSGTGYGHGVGLSQWDAFKMTKEGMDPEAIVTSFFEGVEIQKLYD